MAVIKNPLARSEVTHTQSLGSNLNRDGQPVARTRNAIVNPHSRQLIGDQNAKASRPGVR